MKKGVTLILLLIFTASLLIFGIYGGDIRTQLSPKVKWEYPDYEMTEERIFQKLPLSAVYFDSEGEACVYIIERNDKYRERCFKAVYEKVTVIYEDGKYAYFSESEFPQTEQVIIESDAPLYDDIMIVTE